MIRRIARSLASSRRWLPAAPLVALVVASPAGAQMLTAREHAELEAWYERTVAKTGDGQWGIAVATMDGQVLWSVNPDLELIPASTTKVFTTGFSRMQVGGESRITTRVIGEGRLEPGTGRWIGTWCLDLGGDPTLERAGRKGPSLRELAAELRARGVRVLEGPLALTSRTGTASARFPAVWSADFQGQLYAPPIGPVAIHENTVSLTFRPGADVGSPPSIVAAYPAGVERMVRIAARTVPGSRSRLSLRPDPDGGWTLTGTIAMDRRTTGLSAVAHDPAQVLVAAWASALERAGIRWERSGGPVIYSETSGVTLAQVASPPLDSVASEVNRRSLNIGAELLLQHAAQSQTMGPSLLTRHVREVVGPSARVRLVDGSGLSELNRMSPLTQVLYLAKYPQVPGNERFPLLLPANGTGTLKRLRQGMAKGVVHAKTGTLDRVATLAGYLGRPDGVLVVSAMYNGRRTAAARAAEWELFRLLGGEGVSLSGALETRMGGSSTAGDR